MRFWDQGSKTLTMLGSDFSPESAVYENTLDQQIDAEIFYGLLNPRILVRIKNTAGDSSLEIAETQD